MQKVGPSVRIARALSLRSVGTTNCFFKSFPPLSGSGAIGTEAGAEPAPIHWCRSGPTRLLAESVERKTRDQSPHSVLVQSISKVSFARAFSLRSVGTTNGFFIAFPPLSGSGTIGTVNGADALEAGSFERGYRD